MELGQLRSIFINFYTDGYGVETTSPYEINSPKQMSQCGVVLNF